MQYKILKLIGDGSFGEVYQAQDKVTGEMVAMKKMKDVYSSWEEAMSMPEIKCLLQLQHLNIVKLREVFWSPKEKELFLVFELLQSDMHDLIKARRKAGNGFSEQEIKIIIYSILKGIAHIHKRGFFHRDLKPENLLLDQQNEKVPITFENCKIKVSDFGLCREIDSQPPYTEYIATRWYWAPECVLLSKSYGPKMDVFAIGCIMAELYLMGPLFPGKSQVD